MRQKVQKVFLKKQKPLKLRGQKNPITCIFWGLIEYRKATLT